MSNKTITIFGTGRAKPDDEAYELAQDIGKLLAQAGFTIANGGYGGTMLAAAKAAAQAGGKTIGVTCSAFAATPNKYISRKIVTDSLDERLDTLIKLGHAYIVLPGGTGTLLELAKVWELKNKGFLQQQKPIILVGAFWTPLIDLVATDDPDSKQYVQQLNEPKQIIEFIKQSVI